MVRCPHGDPTCPCSDGDACHYEQVGDSPPSRGPLAGPMPADERRQMIEARNPSRHVVVSDPRE